MVTEKQLRDKLAEYLGDIGVWFYIGEYEEGDFLILDSWDTANSADDFIAEKSDNDDIQNLDDLYDFSWGFNDEYDYCSNCCKVIRTSPDSYCWIPDFWLTEGEGYICGDCVRSDFTEDYIEFCLEKAKWGHCVGFNLLDPTGHGFKLVIEDLENGLHHGMNDDPRKLVHWANANDLQALFKLFPSQFYVKFDLYLRRDNGESLTDNEVTEIREALTTEGLYGYTQLRDEFKQWPTPAQLCEEGLKNPQVIKISKADFIAGKALDHGLDGVVRIEIE